MCSRLPAVDAYISLGSNQGDPPAHLRAACEAVARLPEVAVTAASPVYRTEPQGLRDQPWFANQVLCLRCGGGWAAPSLLDALLNIETALGRRRSPDPALRYGPRVIDLDLLLFGTVRSDEPHCRLPHPRLLERAFVLVPLRDIAPKVILSTGETPDTALRRLAYRVDGERIYQSTATMGPH